jgi:glycosyltransferase involved in cell wall biosynthesis
MITPIWLSIPPEGYGGIESVVYHLSEELITRGEDVRLYTPAGTQTSASLFPTVDAPLASSGTPWSDMLATLYHIILLINNSKDFGLIHMHLNKYQDYLSLPLLSQATVPSLITLHFAPPTDPDSIQYRILSLFSNLVYSGISRSQMRHAPLQLRYVTSNSINKFAYDQSPKRPDLPFDGDYLVWMSKIFPHKRAHLAIEVARISRLLSSF